MADRTTKTFETPGGHSVVMYDYISGGEMQAVARKAPKDGNYSAQIDAGNEAMLTVVRSLDGDADNLLARILDLPLPDYQALSAEVQGLMEPDPK
jgi:hypothetical protein